MSDPKRNDPAGPPPSPPVLDDWSSEDREPDETTPAGRLWYIDVQPEPAVAFQRPGVPGEEHA